MTEATTQTTTLAQLVRETHQARCALATTREVLRAKRLAFEQANADLLEQERLQASVVEVCERETRALAEAHFLVTREKKPAAGVTIKEFETLNYDEAQAFAWAKNAGVAIVPEALDRKAFEKIAKASALPFVYAIVEPRAQIAADLSSLAEG